jgi:hypothetical protein
MSGCVREAVHEREQACRGRRRARDVDRASARRALVDEQGHPREAGRHREQDVDIQTPAPRQILGQRAAEDQADGRPGAGDRTVDPERRAALLGIGERGAQQRQRRRGKERPKTPLQGARAGEHAKALRGAPDRGRDRESRQTGHERQLAAEQVAEPSSQQQQAPERQRVRGDDPLAVGIGEVRAFCADGSAMFTIVASRTTIGCAAPTRARISQRRSDCASTVGAVEVGDTAVVTASPTLLQRGGHQWHHPLGACAP